MTELTTNDPVNPINKKLTDHQRKLEIQKISEWLACFHLVNDGYSDVYNLNERKKHNFEFADVAGTKGGVEYYFSVKGRNRFTSEGKINSSYKIGSLCHATRYEQTLGVVCKWIAVSIDTEKGIYSCYHGSTANLLDGRSGKKRIGMTAGAISRHEAFAVDRQCPRDVSHLRNTLRQPRRNKTVSSPVAPDDTDGVPPRIAALHSILARVAIAARLSR